MSWEPVTHCRVCNDAFDVYRAPDERVCEACRDSATIVVTIEDQRLSPKQQERAEHLRRAMKRMGHAW